MTSREFIPKAYQPPAVDFIVDNPRCNLFARMGMGKTSSTLTALDKLYLCGWETGPTLIIGPKRVARDTWPNEIKKWRHLNHFEISPILGTEKQRLAALRRDVPLYSINYENIPWLRKTLGDRWPFGIVVSDESTRLKGFRLTQGGQRTAALAHYAFGRGVNRWINLTGSPAPNGLQDLWGQCWFVDQGQRLGRSFTAFKERWFQAKVNSDTGYIQHHPLAFAQAEIEQRIADISLTLDPRDYFDLNEPREIPVYIDLPPKVRAIYKDMEARAFAEIEAEGVEAFNAAAKTNKLLQIANGFIYKNAEQGKRATEWIDLHNEKVAALESVLMEAGGTPLLVAYNFRPDLAKLLKAFPQGVDISKKSGQDAFMSGNVPIGFAHPASMGHGIDGLQEITNMIAFYGHDWNLEYYEQMLERIGPVRQLQSGFDRNVFVYHIIASNTMDVEVVARRKHKWSVQEALLKAMNRFKKDIT